MYKQMFFKTTANEQNVDSFEEELAQCLDSIIESERTRELIKIEESLGGTRAAILSLLERMPIFNQLPDPAKHRNMFADTLSKRICALRNGNNMGNNFSI